MENCMAEFIESLRFKRTMSQYASKDDLYKQLNIDRNNAAYIIEELIDEIESLKSMLNFSHGKDA